MIKLTVQLESQQNLYTNDKKVTDLYVYFNRPNAIRSVPGVSQPLDLHGDQIDMGTLKYTEFYTYYSWGKKLSNSNRNTPAMEGRYWWHLTMPNGVKLYITERLKPNECVVRMNMIYPTAGEIYYLRLLLLHFATRSYHELKLDQNSHQSNSLLLHTNVTETFQQSCVAKLLLDDQNEAVRCFEEAMVFGSPKDLRNLFVIQTLQGFPTWNIFYDSNKRKAMSIDFICHHQQGDNSGLAFNDLLKDLATRLQSDGSRLELSIRSKLFINTLYDTIQ